MRRMSVMKALSLIAFGVLLLVTACGDDEEGTSSTPTTAPRTSAPASASPTPNEVCAENPDPATDDLNRVDSPSPGDTVSSPITVSGEIAAFEAAFRITIFDADGEIIADETGMSAEGQTLAPFTEYVPFSVDEETPACIWVYENSARDGEPVNVVQVPVTLEP